MKREADEHPEEPPIRIMRGLEGLSTAVVAKLPDLVNIQKQIQRINRKIQSESRILLKSQIFV